MTAKQPSTTQEAPPKRRRRRSPRRPIQVKRVEPLTPRMIRVTFTGDELSGFGWNGPASHIKLFFPEEGQDEPILPGPDGPRPLMRTYTPRRFSPDGPDGPELDVEFVLHGHGPASTWAAQAKVGQKLIVAGPGRNYTIDPDADWFLLAADDSAIPAISTILEHLPARVRALVLLEVVDEKEERTLESAADATFTWLYRGADPRQAGIPLEAAIGQLDFPEGNGRIYVGCEAGAMRRIRAHLLKERGRKRPTIVTRGYWKLDATNHPDHDYGEDVKP